VPSSSTVASGSIPIHLIPLILTNKSELSIYVRNILEQYKFRVIKVRINVEVLTLIENIVSCSHHIHRCSLLRNQMT
jgi:hypothetical protein